MFLRASNARLRKRWRSTPISDPPTSWSSRGSLQSVENELRLPVTPLELPDVGGSRASNRRDANDDDATRVRGVVQVDAQGSGTSQAGGQAPTASEQSEPPNATVLRQNASPRPDAAPQPARPAPTEEPAQRSPSTRQWLIAAGGAVAVLAVVAVLFLVLGGSGGDSSGPTTTLFSVTNLDDTAVLPPVGELTGVASDDGVTFTWEAPDANGALEYLYTLTTDGSSETASTTATEVSVPAATGSEVCIRIVTTKSGSSDSASREACATA